MIYIVIPVHDRCATTRRCLDALAAQTAAGKTVIVVDDGSSDGTREMLESYPDVVTLRGDGALWWTGATNVGCGWALSRAAGDDAVVTLNDDTIPGPGWLESLLDAAGSSPHSLIGSLLVDSATGRIMDAGTKVDWWTARYKQPWLGAQPEDASASGEYLATDVLSGCGTYVPVAALRQLGPYHAALPQYGADYEYSLRAARAGWNVVVSTRAVLPRHAALTGIHDGGRGWREFAHSFWSIRSANSFRYRVRFGRQACPGPALPSYLLCDLLRVSGGSLRRLALRGFR